MRIASREITLLLDGGVLVERQRLRWHNLLLTGNVYCCAAEAGGNRMLRDKDGGYGKFSGPQRSAHLRPVKVNLVLSHRLLRLRRPAPQRGMGRR